MIGSFLEKCEKTAVHLDRGYKQAFMEVTESAGKVESESLVFSESIGFPLSFWES